MSTRERTSAKKRTASKVPAKKTVKKTASKSAPKKRVGKKISKKKVSPTAAKKMTTKQIVAGKVSTSEKVSLAAGHSLLVLSPFRFPLDVDKIAIHTARFGGVFFVLFGAIFTMFYANQVFSMFATGSLLATTIGIEFSIGGTESQISTQQQSQPRVQNYTENFRYDVIPLAGTSNTVSVTLNPRPEEAWLQTENQDTRQVYELGAMKRSGDTWEYDLNTTTLPDGIYKFQAIARHIDSNGSSYNVTVNDTKTRSLSNFVPEFDAAIQSYGRRLSGTERVIVRADRAEEVEVWVRDTSGKTIDGLGQADKTNATDWLVYIDTSEYDDGEYELYAEISRPVYNETSWLPIKIDNAVATTDTAQNNDDSWVDLDPVEDVVDDVVDEVEDTVDSTTNEIDTKTNPDITLGIVASRPISGFATLNITVYPAEFVELYVQPKSSGIQRYLGLATKVSSNRWTYSFNSKNVPNGEYRFYAKVRNLYGVFTEQSDWEQIYNVTQTVTEKSEIQYTDTAKLVSPEVRIDTNPLYTVTKQTAPTSPSQQLDELIDAQAQESNVTREEIESSFNELIVEYQAELEEALQALASAYRSNDEFGINLAKNRINRIVADVTQSALSKSVKEDIIRHTDERIQYLVNRIQADVEKTNEIIAQRTGRDAAQDTDGDGITDFDEVTIYKTDPRVADSDGDGFTDGAEILNGYDPTDATPEVAVAFESPKEVGVVREDILAVHSISTEDFPGEDEQAEISDIAPVQSSSRAPVALITGKALPNSFATLYVFSTPIVVTVKTDSDGSWFYRFDKELEDGEHQVYVGMTDNAGKIVAKSRPLAFIKEAQAYTQLDQPLVPGTVDDGSGNNIFSQVTPVMLLVASVSVVAIGLVLILLGWHLENRNKLTLVQSPEPSAT